VLRFTFVIVVVASNLGHLGFLHPQYLLKANNDKFQITNEKVFQVLGIKPEDTDSYAHDAETSYDIYLKPPTGAQTGDGAVVGCDELGCVCV
jgi:hypothetical protein